VNLQVDIPTRAQAERLLTSRNPSSVSFYLPTVPASRGGAERIELKNLAAEAPRLGRSQAATSDIAEIDAAVGDLMDDEEFWRYQAPEPRRVRLTGDVDDLQVAETARRHGRGVRPLPPQAPAPLGQVSPGGRD
jgi:hypothetical protein